MPIIKTKKTITFTKEEKELINKMIEMIDEMDCTNIVAPCTGCPFYNLCIHGCADTVERTINRMFDN